LNVSIEGCMTRNKRDILPKSSRYFLQKKVEEWDAKRKNQQGWSKGLWLLIIC
jgi:hypothetical protein